MGETFPLRGSCPRGLGQRVGLLLRVLGEDHRHANAGRHPGLAVVEARRWLWRPRVGPAAGLGPLIQGVCCRPLP